MLAFEKRIARYHSYRNLEGDLKDPLKKEQAKKDLKTFFRGVNQFDRTNLPDKITKCLIHGLAEHSLGKQEAKVFHGLLAVNPELTAKHLVGSIEKYEQKPYRFYERRIRIAKKLFSHKKFATEANTRMLIGFLKKGALQEPITEILTLPHYATEKTANWLVGALGNPEQTQAAFKILSHPVYAKQSTANSLIIKLRNETAAENAKLLLSSSGLATIQTGKNLVGALSETQEPKVIDHVKELLTSPVFAREEIVDALGSGIQKPNESNYIEYILTHPTYLENPDLSRQILHQMLFKLGSKHQHEAEVAERILSRLMKNDEIVKMAIQALRTSKIETNYEGKKVEMSIGNQARKILVFSLLKIGRTG